MNDFDYDSMQKKRIARGAMNKVSHRGCTLPHEHLTKKELKKMNGEVKKYNLTQPMVWAEFRAMPIDLQRKYIKMLQDGYHATCAMLADMFGISSKTVWSYFKDNEINTITKATALKVTHDKIIQEAWKTYCNGVVGGGDNKQEESSKSTNEIIGKRVLTDEEASLFFKEELESAQKKENTMEEKPPIIERKGIPVDKLDIVYHEITSLEQLRNLMGDIEFDKPMQVTIYIREEPKKWYQNLT